MKLRSENLFKCAILIVIALALSLFQTRSDGAGGKNSDGAAGTNAMPTATIGAANNIVKLEVASTPQEIEFGLMKRTSLPDDHGMVFLFHPAHKVQFWMFNCLMSLDMIFIKDGKIIEICKNVPPCLSKNPGDCPKYPDDVIQVTEVIEVPPGYAQKHQIKEGDKVSFQLPEIGSPKP
jgi:uncharacterized membrane protein (UPF0127 family)